MKVDLAVRVGFAEQPETRITAANSRDVNFFILVLRENNSAVFTPCIIAQEAVKIIKILWISYACVPNKSGRMVSLILPQRIK